MKCLGCQINPRCENEAEVRCPRCAFAQEMGRLQDHQLTKTFLRLYDRVEALETKP